MRRRALFSLVIVGGVMGLAVPAQAQTENIYGARPVGEVERPVGRERRAFR